VRFDTVFPKEASPWIYPEFPLRLPEESMAKAVGVSFDLKVKQFDASITAAEIYIVMEDVHEKGSSVMLDYKPAFEQNTWRTISMPLQGAVPAAFDPGEIRLLRVGMNPWVPDFTYWVRNVRVYYERE
jgi:hypothetical protein